MKIFLLIFLMSYLSAFSQWKEFGMMTGDDFFTKIDAQSNFIIATFGATGVVMSSDGGKTWEANYEAFNNRSGFGANSIMIDEENVYAAFSVSQNINDKSNRDGGLYVSSDKGRNWKIVNEEYKDTTFRNLCKDSKGNFYAHTSGININKASLKKSTNKGLTWQELTPHNIPGVEGPYAYIMCTQGDTLFTCIGKYSPTKLVLSSDGGISWKQIKISYLENDTDIRDMKIHNNYYYVVTNKLFRQVDAGSEHLYFSSNYGTDWDTVIVQSDTSGISSISIFADEIFIATYKGAIYKTKLGNEKGNWMQVNDIKLEIANIYANNNFIFAYGKGGIYTSNDSSKTFQKLPILTYDAIRGYCYDSDSLYITTNSGVLVSADYGDTFEPMSELNLLLKEQGYSAYKIAKKNNLFVASPISSSASTILISEDYGKTWNVFNNLSTALYINILEDNSILILTYNRNVKISRDLGRSWEELEIKGGDFSYDQYLIKKLRYLNGKLYIFGDQGAGIFSSSDNAKTWEKVIYPIDFPVNDLDIVDDKLILITPDKICTPAETPGQYITLSNVKGIERVVRYKDNIFAQFADNKGMYLSKGDYFNIDWKNINGSSGHRTALLKGGAADSYTLIKDHLFAFSFSSGPSLRAKLSDFGIEYTSVERTEDRNYLWTNPPYPQPSNNQVKVEVYWDSGLPFTSDDVEIYDLTGVKININGQINVKKENNWKGNIIWDASNQNPGIYIMKITHGTETRTRKILITE